MRGLPLIDIGFPGVIFLAVFIVMGHRSMGNRRQMNDSQVRVIGGDPDSAGGDIQWPLSLTFHPYVQQVVIRGNIFDVKTPSRPLYAIKGSGQRDHDRAHLGMNVAEDVRDSFTAESYLLRRACLI